MEVQVATLEYMCNRNKVFYSDCGKKGYNTEQTERDLVEQARLNMRKEYMWEQRCDEFIKSLDEYSRIKRPRLSIIGRAPRKFERFSARTFRTCGCRIQRRT